MFESAHVSRQIPMHPLEAREAVAAWHQSLLPVPQRRRPVRLERRMWLSPRPEHASADPLQFYAVPGLLWMRCRPIRMSLEFSEWSTTVCAAAIRPVNLDWPVGTEFYGRRVGALLHDVITSLHVFATSRSASVHPASVVSDGAKRWWSLREPSPRPASSAVSAV